MNATDCCGAYCEEVCDCVKKQAAPAAPVRELLDETVYASCRYVGTGRHVSELWEKR